MRVGQEDRRVHRLASDDGSTFGAAHDIEVGWCRLVRRTELQWAHDVHHLAAQRYRRICSLDPRRPRVSRLPWRRIPMDTRTIQPYSREGGFVSTKSHVNRNHRSTEVPLSGPRMRTSGCALFWEPRGFAADRAQGWRRCTSTNHRRRRCQNGRGAGEGRKQRHHS